MKKIIIMIFILLGLSLNAQENNVTIEDNNISVQSRTGLFVSLSGGYASHDLEFLNNNVSERVESYSALATSFKMGLFLDDNIAIYFSNYTTFFSAPFRKDGLSENSLSLDALNGVGASYYFDEYPFFISGSVGGATFMTVGESNAEFGSVYLLSFGYEFENNFNVEIVITKFGEIPSIDYDFLSTQTQSSQILVGYTFY